MRKRDRERAHARRAVNDQIEIDAPRLIALPPHASMARFDRVQLAQQNGRRQRGVTDYDRIEKWRRAGGRIDGIGLVKRADADNANQATQFVDGATQVVAAVAEVRAERDDDRARASARC
jgi:hypothetical protein